MIPVGLHSIAEGGRSAIVDLKYSPEAEAFRHEIRAWLEANAPKDEHRPFDTITVANDAEWQARKDWYRKLHSGGWVGISWPREYGGRDAPVMHAMVFHEELARFHAQLPYIGAGVALAGPTLIQWGTEAQKRRFIPKIFPARRPGARDILSRMRAPTSPL